MFQAVEVVTPPTAEPVSVDLARLHLRVDHRGDDMLIASYITAARSWAEMYLGRVIAQQQLRYTISQDQPPNVSPMLSMPLSLLVLPMWFQWRQGMPGAIILPRQPLISVDYVSYGQWGQAETALTGGSDYHVDPLSGRLIINPAAQVLPNDHLQVIFTAGYATGQAPGPILTAIMILTAFLYENRGDLAADLPMAVEMLLVPYRIVGFGS